jgi:ribosomal protein S14
MATTDPSSTAHEERCDRCGRETPHSVSIRILTENARSENAAFSREPYRVTECEVCGASESVRMNNV